MCDCFSLADGGEVSVRTFPPPGWCLMLSVEPIFERAFRMSGAVPGRLLVLVVAAVPVAAVVLEEEVRAVRAVVVFFSAAAVEEEEGVAGLAVALVLVRDAEGVETEDLAAAVEELLVLGLAESAGRRRRCQESSFNAVLLQTLRNKNGRNMQLNQIKFDLCCTVHVNVAFSIYAALTEHSGASSLS